MIRLLEEMVKMIQTSLNLILHFGCSSGEIVKNNTAKTVHS